MNIRTVIVDDHSLARARLRDLLEDVEDVDCVGEAADGETAITLIGDTRPDIAFLDIHMPGISGLDVLRRSIPRPLAVFTTAHDRYAVTAFELHALDYLLKPFGVARLRTAVDRARSALRAEGRVTQLARVEPAFDRDRPLDRVFVRRRGQIIPVILDRIEHIEARGDYVALWEGSRSHLVRTALAMFCTRLDPERFFPIHRSHVINLDRVTAFTPFDGSRLEVVLESGKRLVASRPRSVELRRRLAL